MEKIKVNGQEWNVAGDPNKYYVFQLIDGEHRYLLRDGTVVPDSDNLYGPNAYYYNSVQEIKQIHCGEEGAMPRVFILNHFQLHALINQAIETGEMANEWKSSSIEESYWEWVEQFIREKKLEIKYESDSESV